MNLPAVSTVELSGHSVTSGTYRGLCTHGQHHRIVKRPENHQFFTPKAGNSCFLSPTPPQPSISADYCLFRTEEPYFSFGIPFSRLSNRNSRSGLASYDEIIAASSVNCLFGKHNAPITMLLLHSALQG